MSYHPSGPDAQPPGFGPPPPSQYPTPGQYGAPGQYPSASPYQPQPGQYPPQPDPYAQPGQYGQPDPYAQPGQYGQPGQYSPSGPGGYPAGPPKRSGRTALFSILGSVLGVALIAGLAFAAIQVMGSGTPDVGDCLDDPPGFNDTFSVVDCSSSQAIFQMVAIETSPSGGSDELNVLDIAADLGCGFHDVLWEEDTRSGRLHWVACAQVLAAGPVPGVGDCLDDSDIFVVVDCDDPAAIEQVTYVATEGLPRNADEAAADALLERCPDPDTDLLYTSWEAAGEAILWMMCTDPLGDDLPPPPSGGTPANVDELQPGNCLDDDPRYFVVVDCTDPAAVHVITHVAVNLTDTADSQDEVGDLALDLCGLTGWEFYFDGWGGQAGSSVGWIVCVDEV